MKNKHDYTGKKIFVGIDVHKKTYSVAIVFEGELVKRVTMQAVPEKLTAYLKKYFSRAEIKSAYEAGFSGYFLHRHLIAEKIDNIIVHPAAIETSANNRVKTDKKDALKIAIQLFSNRLQGIYVPSPEEEDRRELTRLRETLVKEKRKMTARLKQKANYYGLIGPSDSQKISAKWIERILAMPLGPELRYHIEALIEQWNQLQNKLKEIDKRLKENAKADKKEAIYRSVKGIGPTASRVLSNELGNMSRFSSERDLFSYTGLTPSEHSSGEHRRQGHISRQGKPILRKILVQCSWIAIRYDKNLAEIYQKIAYRAGAKRAIVAIARRLIGRLRACFKKNELYVSDPI
ncbi:MAG: IS110 family transposase [Chlamydiota bacterium]